MEPENVAAAEPGDEGGAEVKQPTMDEALMDALSGALEKDDDSRDAAAAAADAAADAGGETAAETPAPTPDDGADSAAGDAEGAAPADGAAAPDASADGAEKPEGSAEPPEDGTPAEMLNGRDITKAPTTWKAEASKDFEKLPREIREEIHRREEDMHVGLNQYREAANFGVGVAKQFQPYQHLLEQNQIEPLTLIDAALQFETAMRQGSDDEKVALLHNLGESYGLQAETDQQKVDLVRKFARSFGLDFGEVEFDGHQPDPEVSALKAEIGELKSRLGERDQRDVMTAQEEENAARAEIQAEIAAFRADPKNEFFGQVQQDVLKLIQSGQASDLRDAYDKAIWTNPATRATLIARQQEADRKSAAEKAAAADKANRLNIASRATPPGNASGAGTMEDRLRANIDNALTG